MKYELIRETTIYDAYVCPIEYGDFSGIVDYDEEQGVIAWINQYPNAVFKWGDYEELAVCDISGMHANCIAVEIYQLVNE